MKCLVCEKETVSTCSGCTVVAYCSVNCQKGNWKEHRASCRSFVVSEEDDEGVKYVKANRDIKLESIIREESPLFHIPQYGSSGTIEQLCITCGHSDDEKTGKLVKCATCGWPTCGKKCSEMAIHKELECSYFKSHDIKYIPSTHLSKNLSQILLMVRVMLIKRDKPELWNNFLDLGLQNQNTQGTEFNPLCFGKTLNKRLKSELGADGFLEALKDCSKMGHLLLSKGFYSTTSNISDPSYGIRSGIFLFKTAIQHIRHSCTPNISWKIGNAPEFKLRLRTIATINTGDELTICRYPYYKEMRQGTIERRSFISTRMGFFCKCTRCLDPTELNTFSSAIACSSCRPIEEGIALKRDDPKSEEFNLGYFLPENPHEESADKWKCNKCSKVVPISDVYPEIVKISEELDRIEKMVPSPSSASEKSSIVQRDLKMSLFYLSQLLHGFLPSDGFLHPNHWLIMRTMEIVINLNSSRMAQGSPTIEEIDNYIKMCKHYITVQEHVMPGEHSYQSLVVYLLTLVMKKKINRLFMGRNAKKHVKEINELSEEVADILMRGIAYYKNEIPNSSDSLANEVASRYVASLKHLKDMISAKLE